MMISPDEPYSTKEAAEYLRKSTRQVQRYLTSGALKANKREGVWQITALALWKYQGIEQEMTDLWLRFCSRNDPNEGAE